jgi:hypothetical protein
MVLDHQVLHNKQNNKHHILYHQGHMMQVMDIINQLKVLFIHLIIKY